MTACSPRLSCPSPSQRTDNTADVLRQRLPAAQESRQILGDPASPFGVAWGFAGLRGRFTVVVAGANRRQALNILRQILHAHVRVPASLGELRRMGVLWLGALCRTASSGLARRSLGGGGSMVLPPSPHGFGVTRWRARAWALRWWRCPLAGGDVRRAGLPAWRLLGHGNWSVNYRGSGGNIVLPSPSLGMARWNRKRFLSTRDG